MRRTYMQDYTVLAEICNSLLLFKILPVTILQGLYFLGLLAQSMRRQWQLLREAESEEWTKSLLAIMLSGVGTLTARHWDSKIQAARLQRPTLVWLRVLNKDLAFKTLPGGLGKGTVSSHYSNSQAQECSKVSGCIQQLANQFRLVVRTGDPRHQVVHLWVLSLHLLSPSALSWRVNYSPWSQFLSCVMNKSEISASLWGTSSPFKMFFTRWEFDELVNSSHWEVLII